MDHNRRPTRPTLAVVVEDVDRRAVVAIHLAYGWKNARQIVREQSPIYEGDTAARIYVIRAEGVVCRWSYSPDTAVPANDAARSARRRATQRKVA